MSRDYYGSLPNQIYQTRKEMSFCTALRASRLDKVYIAQAAGQLRIYEYD